MNNDSMKYVVLAQLVIILVYVIIKLIIKFIDSHKVHKIMQQTNKIIDDYNRDIVAEIQKDMRQKQIKIKSYRGDVFKDG